MEKSKAYNRVFFSPETLIAARNRCEAYSKKKEDLSSTFEVALQNGERWEHDTQEEFLAD